MNKYQEWLKSGKKKIYNKAADKPRISFMALSALLGMLAIIGFYAYSAIRMIYTPKIKQIERSYQLQTATIEKKSTEYYDYLKLVYTPSPEVQKTRNVEKTVETVKNYGEEIDNEYTEIIIPVRDSGFICAYGYVADKLVVECTSEPGQGGGTDVRSTARPGQEAPVQ